MPFLTESAQLGSEFLKRELGLDVELRVSDRTQVKKAGRAGELDGQIQWVENETKTDLTRHYTSKYGDRSITKSLSSVHNDRSCLAWCTLSLRYWIKTNETKPLGSWSRVWSRRHMS